MFIDGLSAIITSAILSDPRTRDITPMISVSSNFGIITLNGQVPSEQVRQAAEEIARETEGVVYVHNELNVGSSSFDITFK